MWHPGAARHGDERTPVTQRALAAAAASTTPGVCPVFAISSSEG
jgi:hypothetical protein